MRQAATVPAVRSRCEYASSDAAASSQAEVSDEIATIAEKYAAEGGPEDRVRLDYPPYRSSILRHPTKDPHHADPRGSSCGPRPSLTRRRPARGRPT